MIAHHELVGVGVLALFGVVFRALAPAKQATVDRIAP